MTPIKFRPVPDPQTIRSLTSVGLHPLVAQCAAARGLSDTTVALLKHKLLPYRELKGIKEMAVGLARAILNKEKMVVVADYDCDGATACTVAVSGLRALGADIDFVVPNRMVHGYGLTPSVVDLAAEKNPRWIVTVDNGIASIDGVNAANAKGIGVWVTDHHLPGETLPHAAGIVNPNQPHCPFSSKNLAGCGVMFYVMAATRDALKAMGHDMSHVDMADWLDVVALGTVADVVRLDDNNRWLVHQGLMRIRQGLMRPGIAALFEVSKRDYEFATAQDFGFSLGPRLNAAGRLDDMTIGIRCLLSNDYDEALDLAYQLQSLNEERKSIESDMKENAQATLEAEKQKERFTRVVFGDDFHEGVIGIVAGRIKEKDFAPTIVFAKSHDGLFWKGSGRSIPGLHLRDVIDVVYKKRPDWFLKFGGHAMAAGLTLHAKAREEGFSEEFEKAVRDWFNHDKPQQFLVVDGKLDAQSFSVDAARHLSEYVWGQGFEEPLWFGEFIVNDVLMVGKEKNHLKMSVTPIGGGPKMGAMHFHQKEEDAPEQGSVISMAYRLQYSVFNDDERVDLIVVERQ